MTFKFYRSTERKNVKPVQPYWIHPEAIGDPNLLQGKG